MSKSQFFSDNYREGDVIILELGETLEVRSERGGKEYADLKIRGRNNAERYASTLATTLANLDTFDDRPKVWFRARHEEVPELRSDL